MTLTTRWIVVLAAILVRTAAVVATEVEWEHVVVDPTFRSEGVATADVDRDGMIDILVGDVWYEAPAFDPHAIRPPGAYQFDEGYSNAFSVWAYDVNRDGWQDQIVVGFPGKPLHWYENPQTAPGLWRESVIHHEASNESPFMGTLTGDERPEIVLGSERRLGSLTVPANNFRGKWKFRALSEPGDPKQNGAAVYYHGLGRGDVNGDGHADVVIPHGWYEAPADGDLASDWTFHPLQTWDDQGMKPPPAAHIFVDDLDLDGDGDLLMSSAHNYGIWWLENLQGDRFHVHVIDRQYSQTHALAFVDIDGDGQKDLVTGKRFFAHNGRDTARNHRR